MAGKPSKRMGGKPKATKSSASTAVFLIANHTTERTRLDFLLAGFGFRLHSYQTAREFLLDKQNLAGGVVISDFRLQGMTGLELFEFLRKEQPLVPVILITGRADAPAAIRTGSSDFLIRPVDPDQLRAAVIRAVNGEEYDEAKLERAFARITDREYRILDIVAAGESSREIADRLGISTKTVEAHRARISDKTRAENLSHLIRMFRAWNKLNGKSS